MPYIPGTIASHRTITNAMTQTRAARVYLAGDSSSQPPPLVPPISPSLVDRGLGGLSCGQLLVDEEGNQTNSDDKDDAKDDNDADFLLGPVLPVLARKELRELVANHEAVDGRHFGCC